MSTERIVVQRSVAEKFRKILADTAEKIFGKDGPAPVLVTSATVDKNKKMVADAMSKGANVIFGDPNATEANSYSMRPMIVDNVTNDMDIYSTESFGPTVSMLLLTARMMRSLWPMIPNMALHPLFSPVNYSED